MFQRLEARLSSTDNSSAFPVGLRYTPLRSSPAAPPAAARSTVLRYAVITLRATHEHPSRGRPEDRARANIDRLLTAAGWIIQSRDSINIEASRGVALREFPLSPGHGFADYLLYIDGYAAGVVEAKKQGVPLVEVEIQSIKYSQGLPQNLPAPRRPLPFCYQSTGIETRFTNLLEPDARSRPVFGFHRPETLVKWLESDLKSPGSTVRGHLRIMPPLPRDGLWDHQHRVIANLEQSLSASTNRRCLQSTRWIHSESVRTAILGRRHPVGHQRRGCILQGDDNARDDFTARASEFLS